MRVSFWYRVIMRDQWGVAAKKEGDVPGTNVLYALNCIENMNKNSWKGKLVAVHLYEMDFENGVIEEDPVISWSRFDEGGELRAMDWKPPVTEEIKEQPCLLPAPTQTSHSVSFFNASEYGEQVSRGNKVFQSTDLKEL